MHTLKLADTVSTMTKGKRVTAHGDAARHPSAKCHVNLTSYGATYK